MINKDALLEAFKELFRVVLLAVIPVAIQSVEENFIDLRTIGVVALLAALRFIDKYLHETGKDVEKRSAKKEQVTSILTGGLTRF